MLCSGQEHTVTLESGPYRLWKCQGCGLVSLCPMPPENQEPLLYGEGYYSRGLAVLPARLWAPALRLLRWSQVRKVVGRREKGRILDVGCGDGRFLEAMARRGWEVRGVETSAEGYRLARDRLGPSIWNAELGDCAFPESYFDVVTLWHVLEHVAYPLELLPEVRRVLKDDGVLIIAVPDIESVEARLAGAGWFHLDLPRHLFHYSPRTLVALLERTGLKATKVSHLALEYKHVLAYSLMSWIGNATGLSLRSRALALPLIPPALLGSYLMAAMGRSGTIEVYAAKA